VSRLNFLRLKIVNPKCRYSKGHLEKPDFYQLIPASLLYGIEKELKEFFWMPENHFR